MIRQQCTDHLQCLQTDVAANAARQAERMQALEARFKTDLQYAFSTTRWECEAQRQQMQDGVDAVRSKHIEQVQALQTQHIKELDSTFRRVREDHQAQLNQMKASWEADRSGQTAKFEAERSKWQRLVQQLTADRQEIATLAMRRQHDSKQLQYIIRGQEGTSGSVPCQLFGAEPNSLLNKIFNGDWAFATDGQGRAIINSNPAHWPLILDWLSFGACPAHPTEAFIAEC